MNDDVNFNCNLKEETKDMPSKLQGRVKELHFPSSDSI